MNRTLTPLDLRAKQAAKALQRAVGGIEAAAEITGKSSTSHG